MPWKRMLAYVSGLNPENSKTDRDGRSHPERCCKYFGLFIIKWGNYPT